MDAVNAFHSRDIAENDLVRANSHHGSELLKHCLHDPTLLHAYNMCYDPKVGDGGIPWAGKRGERREENTIDEDSKDIARVEGYRKPKGVGWAE